MAEAQYKVALIICSTRQPRVGPAIASWITSAITAINSHGSSNIILTTIDLLDHPLPISVSGLPPAGLPNPPPENAYSDPAVNAWSALIQSYHAFIFLTPQYNWSFPASIKIAIDHLFHEWKGKPALIVSYGTRGGGKANGQLRQVLHGLKMNPWEGNVLLPLVAGRGVEDTARGVLSEEALEAWNAGGQLEEVKAQWEELVAHTSIKQSV
ncbi:flavoprotein-like protein [Bisporella sp. PMI_857]|nr:flavoprotein-like protein [Bisporella sp. PMI_857]